MNTENIPINPQASTTDLLKLMEALFQRAQILLQEDQESSNEFRTVMDNLNNIDALLEKRNYR